TGANGAQYGYLYNWCAAMGGVGRNPNACNLTSTTGQDTSTSICSAGWRLPTAGTDGTAAQDNTNEFWNLNQIANSGATSTDAGLVNNWLGVYSGIMNTQGNFSNANIRGYYWSSTINTANNVRNLIFFTNYTDVANNGIKADGFSVRCVQ
ncbi:hypothetical protein FWH09_03175, partial [Candidatus Saccharibacteria bacterium]|nr:hypothetical protein [Candidatus Saccharibacteria bacterium]